MSSLAAFDAVAGCSRSEALGYDPEWHVLGRTWHQFAGDDVTGGVIGDVDFLFYAVLCDFALSVRRFGRVQFYQGSPS